MKNTSLLKKLKTGMILSVVFGVDFPLLNVINFMFLSLPFFVKQFHKLLTSLHSHSLQLNEASKREIAEYMIPEV